MPGTTRTPSPRGISDAFFQAESLVRHVGDGLADPEMADPELLDTALRWYADDRDAALAEGYQATLATALLETPEMRLSLLRAVEADPDLPAIYFDMVAGAESTRALYTPKLLALL